DFSLKCIKDKRIPIGITLLVTGMLLAIVALAGERLFPKLFHGKTAGNNAGGDGLSLFPARKCPSCPSCHIPDIPECLESGIGLGNKCFYFLEKELDWNGSEASCNSQGSRLASIDSPRELEFLVRYGNKEHLWIGLRRGSSGSWEWVNGSLYNG
ncbi:CLC2A protein, partial [Calyptomena viridis]|nr:CLC2A protein [Calyptomena viridis]